MGKVSSADKMRIQTLCEQGGYSVKGGNGCVPTELLEAQYGEENL